MDLWSSGKRGGDPPLLEKQGHWAGLGRAGQGGHANSDVRGRRMGGGEEGG